MAMATFTMSGGAWVPHRLWRKQLPAPPPRSAAQHAHEGDEGQGHIFHELCGAGASAPRALSFSLGVAHRQLATISMMYLAEALRDKIVNRRCPLSNGRTATRRWAFLWGVSAVTWSAACAGAPPRGDQDVPDRSTTQTSPDHRPGIGMARASRPAAQQSIPPESVIQDPDSLTLGLSVEMSEALGNRSLRVRATIRNSSTRFTRVRVTGCSFSLLVYRSRHDGGAPIWDERVWRRSGDEFRGCPFPSDTILPSGGIYAPSYMRYIGTSRAIAEILGDSLPEGPYFASAVFELNGQEVVVPATEVLLTDIPR